MTTAVFPPAIGKESDRLDTNFGMTTGLGEGNSEFKPKEIYIRQSNYI